MVWTNRTFFWYLAVSVGWDRSIAEYIAHTDLTPFISRCAAPQWRISLSRPRIGRRTPTPNQCQQRSRTGFSSSRLTRSHLSLSASCAFSELKMVMAIIPKWYLFVSFRFRMKQIWSTVVRYSCSSCSYLANSPPHLCHPLRTIEVREGVCQATRQIGESAGGHPWNRSCFEEWCLFKAYLVQSQCHNHCFS